MSETDTAAKPKTIRIRLVTRCGATREREISPANFSHRYVVPLYYKTSAMLTAPHDCYDPMLDRREFVLRGREMVDGREVLVFHEGPSLIEQAYLRQRNNHCQEHERLRKRAAYFYRIASRAGERFGFTAVYGEDARTPVGRLGDRICSDCLQEHADPKDCAGRVSGEFL